MGNRNWILAACAGLAMAGCGHGPRSVSDPDPADKIPAMKEAAQTHNQRAIPQMVADLDSDDPAVRLYSIDALQKLTGQTFGYRYYDDDEARKPAVAKWKQWLLHK
ncbi:MAG TPA: hypothetical protein VH370_14480 [Humisphaera sp.]|jgi:hypothetical protein|nr:hypothetical protein [Humisphaera sp.]